MRFYLKFINPLIALVILIICTWILFGGHYIIEDSKGMTPFDKGDSIFENDGFALYFFAKGLFSSSMVFLFGEFFRRWLDKS